MAQLPYASESLQTVFKCLTLFTIIVNYLNYLQFTLAFVLNVYKPGLYLEISLYWKNRYIILLDLLTAAVLAAALVFFMNILVIMKVVAALLLLDLLLQLVIIIECCWGWRRMWKMMRTLSKCNTSVAPAPADLGEIELSVIHPAGEAEGVGSNTNTVSITIPANIQVC